MPPLISIDAVLDRPQQSLFPFSDFDREVASTPEVDALLGSNCVVAIGVSGGKDSDACALALNRFLEERGHSGPRVLIHADLGRVEWLDSLPSCRRLADHIGWELVTVKRKAGDLLARWQGRWANNVARYRNLECVKLIHPWSTPSMRFCTSELKTQPIQAALRKRFAGRDILNVTGIRRQESNNRSKMPVSATLPGLSRKSAAGVSWNPIIDWTLPDVLSEIRASGKLLHEAYSRYGSSRVSCAFCIMSSSSDLVASAGCEENHPLLLELVRLEAQSTFGFQGNRWLADVSPSLLPSGLLSLIAKAKVLGEQRRTVEARIPAHFCM